jgi:hypothetical protein
LDVDEREGSSQLLTTIWQSEHRHRAETVNLRNINFMHRRRLITDRSNTVNISVTKEAATKPRAKRT